MEEETKLRQLVVKLQNLPERKKKIILIAALVCCALVLGAFEIAATGRKLAKLADSLQKVQMPDLNLANAPGGQENIDTFTTIGAEISSATDNVSSGDANITK